MRSNELDWQKKWHEAVEKQNHEQSATLLSEKKRKLIEHQNDTNAKTRTALEKEIVALNQQHASELAQHLSELRAKKQVRARDGCAVVVEHTNPLLEICSSRKREYVHSY